MNGKTGNPIENMLTVTADMESFAPVGDHLTQWAENFADDELSEEDLDFVAAAGSGQSYAAFLKRFRLDAEK